MKLFGLLKENAILEKKVALDAGHEIAHAIYRYAFNKWYSNSELQTQYKTPKLYFEALSTYPTSRKYFLNEFVELVEQAIDKNISEIVGKE